MALLGVVSTSAHAEVPALAYDDLTRGPVPIPPSERSLQTVIAEPWLKVSNQGIILEGPAFERNGDLVFCDVSGMRVLRVTPQQQLSTVVTLNGMSPGGLAIGKEGLIFIAAINLAKGTVHFGGEVGRKRVYERSFPPRRATCRTT
jgi:lactonase